MQKFSVLIVCLTILGCASRQDMAPIENATNIPSYFLSDGNVSSASKKPSPVENSSQSSTTVGALSNNDNVKPLPVAPAGNKKESHVLASTPALHASSNQGVVPDVNAPSGWIVPTAGKTNGYKASSKGIDIVGKVGQPIYAANDGKVVYSGNGLKGYGNLIIVKHDSTYLTAYAHNKTNLVKEGASVKRGQKIAEMGEDDDGNPVLHFELRKNGKPMDPFILIKGE